MDLNKKRTTDALKILRRLGKLNDSEIIHIMNINPTVCNSINGMTQFLENIKRMIPAIKKEHKKENTEKLVKDIHEVCTKPNCAEVTMASNKTVEELRGAIDGSYEKAKDYFHLYNKISNQTKTNILLFEYLKGYIVYYYPSCVEVSKAENYRLQSFFYLISRFPKSILLGYSTSTFKTKATTIRKIIEEDQYFSQLMSVNITIYKQYTFKSVIVNKLKPMKTFYTDKAMEDIDD